MKRGHAEFGNRRSPDRDQPAYIHYRVLVPLSRAGSVIGKGGEFITQIKDITGAKLSVDKAVQGFDERVAHIESSDTPGKELCPAQQGLLFVYERIVREEDTKLPPEKAAIKLLVFKNQITTVIGAKGSTVNDIRKTTGAIVRIGDAAAANSLCLPEDELIQISGTNDQVRQALIGISAALRRAPAPPRRIPPPHPTSPRGGQGKRARLEGPPPPANGGSGKAPPYGGQPPPPAHPRHEGRGGQGPGGPHGNAPFAPPVTGPPRPPAHAVGMLAGLSGAARVALCDGRELDVTGLEGTVSVQYRILVPEKRVGAVLGKGGSVIRSIRNATGARLHLTEPLRGCPERIAITASTEDVRDPGCCGIDAAMAIIATLLEDELHRPAVHVQRLLLGPGELEAVMGKGSSTLKRLRTATGADLKPLPRKETPACGAPDDEVLSIEGPADRVREACAIVLVALRMFSARAQLLHGQPLPDGAPPVTQRPAGYEAHHGFAPPARPLDYQNGAPIPALGAPQPPAIAPPGPAPPVYDQYGQLVQQGPQQPWQEQQGRHLAPPPAPQQPTGMGTLVYGVLPPAQYGSAAGAPLVQPGPPPQDPRYAAAPQDPRFGGPLPSDPRYGPAAGPPQDHRYAPGPPATDPRAAQDPRLSGMPAAQGAPSQDLRYGPGAPSAYGPVGGTAPQQQQQQQQQQPYVQVQDYSQLVPAAGYAQQQPQQQAPPQQQLPQQQALQQQGQQQQLLQVPNILQRLGLTGSGPTLGGGATLGALQPALGGSYGAVGEQLGAPQQQQQPQYQASTQYQPQAVQAQAAGQYQPPAVQGQGAGQYQSSSQYQPLPAQQQQGQQAYQGAATSAAPYTSQGGSYVPAPVAQQGQQQQQQQQGQYGAPGPAASMGLGSGYASLGLAGSGPALGAANAPLAVSGGAQFGGAVGGPAGGAQQLPGAGGSGQQSVPVQTSLKLLISAQQVELLQPKLEQVRQLSGAGITLYSSTTASGDREMEITGSMAQATAAQNFIQVLITSGLA